MSPELPQSSSVADIPAQPLIRACDVSKVYVSGKHSVRALDRVSFDIDAGEFVAIMGPSGSGKSTMMNITGALDVPTEGIMRFDGIDISRLPIDSLAQLRNRSIGFVFQQFHLLPRQPVLEQVMLPLVYARQRPAEREKRARHLLEEMGLGHRIDHLPNQLSGGQQQRVAIARALANHPKLILADEPTGALDSRTSAEIMRLFCSLNRQGITIVLVTHDSEVAAYARRRITFRDGRILTDQITHGATLARGLGQGVMEAAS